MEKWPAIALLVVELDMHHAVVIFVRVRIKQDAIDNAEDGGCRADAKRQGENRCDDKARRLPKLAKREAQVLQQGPHGRLRTQGYGLRRYKFLIVPAGQPKLERIY